MTERLLKAWLLFASEDFQRLHVAPEPVVDFGAK